MPDPRQYDDLYDVQWLAKEAPKPALYILGFTFVYLFFTREVHFSLGEFMENVFLIAYPALFGLCMLVLPGAVLYESEREFGVRAYRAAGLSLLFVAVSLTVFVVVLQLVTGRFVHAYSSESGIPFFPFMVWVCGSVLLLWFTWVSLAVRILRASMRSAAQWWLTQADVTARNATGFAPLHTAVQSERADLVELVLARGAPADLPAGGYDEGLAPLHLAAKSGSVEVAETLLAHGADPNSRTKEGNETPLHHATRSFSPDGPRVLELLLGHGAEVGAQTTGGRQPLHWAAGFALSPKTRDVVSALLSAGADACAADSDGNTPLHDAVRVRSIDVVKLLLAHGAHADARNLAGETPLTMAEKSGDADLTSLLGTVNTSAL